MNKLIIGTRGSKLALTQVEMVKAELLKFWPDLQLEVKIIKTSGDIFKDANLAEIGGKELFTKEIDEALLNGEIDIAVHSLKDVPGIISPKQQIIATLLRADARDALIGAKSFAELPQGAIVGSASPRRKAQILHNRPDLKVVNFRGNVPTRIEKVTDKEVDCTLLAMAGIDRLGLKVEKHALPIDEMLPAAGQGIIGIAARSDDKRAKELLAPINHDLSFVAATAERAVLKTYGGTCYTPIAAYAEITGDNVTLKALIASTEGEQIYKTSASAPTTEAEKLGERIGAELLQHSKNFT